MPGLMNYRSGLQGQQEKQELFKEEGGSPINVLSTITPESLTNLMQRFKGGVSVGEVPGASDSANNPSAGLGSTPGTGLQKYGDKPIAEQTKVAGFNKEGWNKTLNTFMPGAKQAGDYLLPGFNKYLTGEKQIDVKDFLLPGINALFSKNKAR